MSEGTKNFMLPSIHAQELISGRSYVHYTPVPKLCASLDDHVANQPSAVERPPCVLGVDEAGRGPVIGPMIYGAFYLPINLEHTLLTSTYSFDDSKTLTTGFRSKLMETLCNQETDLFESCGWAIKSLSARDIGAGMLKHGGSYNLNSQAMDGTIEIIQGVIERGVNIQEVYIDTIGSPSVYQKKLERIFPTIKIRVEKKADSLFPCVSAASIVAKVTRDVSCELLYRTLAHTEDWAVSADECGWGSGYPSDTRCVSWLQQDMNPLFGWGSETRLSWGTVKDMMELKAGHSGLVEWPMEVDDGNARLSQFFSAADSAELSRDGCELRSWFGSRVGPELF